MNDIQKQIEEKENELYQKLNKLLQLKNEEILTEEEYEYKKKNVINEYNYVLEILKKEHKSNIINKTNVEDNYINKDKKRVSKELKIITFIIIIVIITTTIIGYQQHQNQLNEKYIKAKEALKITWYDDALIMFKELGNYKDSESLYMKTKYDMAVSMYEGSRDFTVTKTNCQYFPSKEIGDEITKEEGRIISYTILNEMKGYEQADKYLKYIDYENDYESALYSINQHLFDEALETLDRHRGYKETDDLIEKIQYIKSDPVKYAIDLVEEGKFDEAQDFTLFHREKNNEYKAIYIYSQAKEIESYGFGYSELTVELDEINPKYDGIYSKEIKEMALQVYGTLDKWTKKYEINLGAKKYAKKLRPTLGMTAEEVRNSTWGNPEDINKTTTTYGISEQWVYSIDRYIYFDDGVVTAIQE